MLKTIVDLRPILPLDRVSAALLAQTSSHFEARLTLEKEGIVINLKSMLGLLSQPNLGDGKMTLIADGEDEKEATEAILTICRK